MKKPKEPKKPTIRFISADDDKEVRRKKNKEYRQEYERKKIEYEKNKIEYEKKLKEYKLLKVLKKFKIENEIKQRLKPILNETSRFRNIMHQFQLHNQNENGMESLRILNSSIPTLISKLKQYHGYKIVVNVVIEVEHKETNEIKEFPLFISREVDNIILNINHIKEYIENAKSFLRNKIPEMEMKDTGWRFHRIIYALFGLNQYKPINGSSYLKLDDYVSNKKCCINIQNEDNKCLMYCVLYHIFKDEIKHKPERVSQYNNYLQKYDWSNITFPINLHNIKKVENLIDHGINVYGYDEITKCYPLEITKRKDENEKKIINLLLIADETKKHYVYIKNLDVLLMPNKKNEEGKHIHNKKYFCQNCLHGFSTKERRKIHIDNGCDYFEPVKTIMPNAKTDDLHIHFKNHNRRFKAPVVIYADFETFIEKNTNLHNDSQSSTTHQSNLPPCGYCFNVVSDYDELNFGLTLYRGKSKDENVPAHFIKNLLSYGDKIKKILEKEKRMIITKSQEEEFQKSTCCHICKKSFLINDVKVRDHDHINGFYRGASHQKCNINLNNKNFKIPVYFHNLKGFDGHLIIQGLKEINFENIQIIAQNFEKYMTFSFGDFRFLDTFSFLSSSLDTLSSNLLKDGKENFKYTLNHFQKEKADLILKKGVYPYEYMDCYEKFDETSLPIISKFYSSLNESHIEETDYEHAKKIWNEFNIQNLGEYHDLYLKTDVLLLTDVFESFRITAMKNYGLDPSQGYFTLPNYAWDCMLKMTGVSLEKMTDIDMYQFCEKAIRGGTSLISHRYAKANNKYMKNYVEDVISSYIIYLDANNLYGQSMVQKLPLEDFTWLNHVDENYIQNFDIEGEYGLFVECDLHYPKSLHDEHNNYPLAVENKSIHENELSPYQINQLKIHSEKHNHQIKKLIPNLYDKIKYICHIKNLQYYLSKGLVLKKIHRVLMFKQRFWLKPYIDFNTQKRAESKNEFEKDMYKLMNNAVFGKTMENIRERVDIQLYTNESLILKQISKPQFLDSKIYSNELVAIKKLKKEITLDKPIYVGVTVLDLSKLHMYQFHYDFIVNKYKTKQTLLFTDTDSLCYHIQTEDIYKDMEENKELFDRSGYNGTDYRKCDNLNKKVIGKFKDETDGNPIIEFVGLRSKMYSVLLENNKEKKTGKGIKKCILKKQINHENYKKCLFSNEKSNQRQYVSFNNLKTIDHNIYQYRFTKVGLSCSNDKQYLLEDGIHSYSYGHYKIKK